MDLFGAPSLLWFGDSLGSFAALIVVSIAGSAFALRWLRDSGTRAP